MPQRIFQSSSELQNISETAPKASPSFSVSEKLAHYGSSALSGVEHLTLLVGKESVALALIRHFGSLKALARASFQELRQFLPRRKAEAVVAALSKSAIAETEHARREQLDHPESIYRACADMKLFNQEVLRVILLDTRYCTRETSPYLHGSSWCHTRCDVCGASSSGFDPIPTWQRSRMIERHRSRWSDGLHCEFAFIRSASTRLGIPLP